MAWELGNGIGKVDSVAAESRAKLPEELFARLPSSQIVVVVEPCEPREYRRDSEGKIIAVPPLCPSIGSSFRS